MKSHFLFVLLFLSALVYSQQDERISTLDFVQILNGNTEEAHFYYQNNWKKLREAALEKDYIHSYEMMETEPTENAPFHLILITSYTDAKTYGERENHFSELIEQAGELKLLNRKKPSEFRKNLFNKENVRHWETKEKS